MTNLRTDELKNRVLAKQHELEARLSELKARAQGRTADEAERVKAQLADLKESVKDGWDNITDQTAKRLNDWLRS